MQPTWLTPNRFTTTSSKLTTSFHNKPHFQGRRITSLDDSDIQRVKNLSRYRANANPGFNARFQDHYFQFQMTGGQALLTIQPPNPEETYSYLLPANQHKVDVYRPSDSLSHSFQARPDIDRLAIDFIKKVKNQDIIYEWPDLPQKEIIFPDKKWPVDSFESGRKEQPSAQNEQVEDSARGNGLTNLARQAIRRLRELK